MPPPTSVPIADAHGPVRAPHVRGVEEPGAEKRVRRRAVHDGGAGLGEPRALALREVDSVRVQAAGSEQAESVVDVGVVLRPRKQPSHELDLPLALRQVAVHVAVGVPGCERAGPAELLLGRSHRETHGDRVAQPPATVPALDQRLAVARARFGVVAQRVGGVAIHQRLAADDGLTAALGHREERLGGGPVNGGEDDRGGGAVLHQTVEERFGRGARVRRRGVALLLGEREPVQPVEQVPAGGGQHPVLREVDVGVDEARHHQRVAVVVGREGTEPLRHPAPMAAPDDASVAGDHDRAVAMESNRTFQSDDGGIVVVGQDRAADHAAVVRGAHGATRSSMRNRRMRSTLARAVTRSVSASLSMRASNAARIASFVAPFTAKNEGDPEALAVAGVHIMETRELLGGEPVEPRACLLAPRFLPDFSDHRRAAREVRMRAQQRDLPLARRGADGRGERLHQRLAIGERPCLAGGFGNPGGILGNIAESSGKLRDVERVHRLNGQEGHRLQVLSHENFLERRTFRSGFDSEIRSTS